MENTPLSTDAVRQLLDDQLTGRAPWSVRLGHGTYVFLEFGEVVDAAPTRPRGSTQLWVVESIWRIEDGSRLVCGSDDEGTVMAEGLAQLTGQAVTSAELVGPLLDLQLTFGSGLALRTFRCSAEEDAWRLFVDSSTVFHAPDGSFARESAGPV